MVNNTPDSKLDEAVKQTLKNYEAKYDASDWARMESMLDAAPKTVSFKWSYVLNGVIAVVVCGGVYIGYSAISSKQNTSVKTETTSPLPAPKKTEPAVVKSTPPPVNTTINTVQPAVESPSTITTTTTPVQLPVNPALTANVEQKKIKTKVKDVDVQVEDPDLKNLRVIGMGNEPVFGDMLDSSKGIVKETQEKLETKEAAKKSKDLPVGWNSFMLSNVNPDSIKSYKERMKKDSTKVQ